MLKQKNKKNISVRQCDTSEIIFKLNKQIYHG